MNNDRSKEWEVNMEASIIRGGILAKTLITALAVYFGYKLFHGKSKEERKKISIELNEKRMMNHDN